MTTAIIQPTFDLETVPERDRLRVAQLIPNPQLAQEYVHRHLEQLGGLYDFDVLDKAVERRSNVLLEGPTGTAKTTFFRAYAAARGLPFALVECNAAMDPGTILGRTMPDEHGLIRFIDGDWTLIVRYGGVGLVDEINLLHPRLTASFHQVLAVTRRMSVVEAGETIIAGAGGVGEPQPVLFGACLNPRNYEGTMRLNQALRNRFSKPIDWGYSREVEEQLVDSPTLLDLAGTMRNLGEIRTPVSTNMLQEFQQHFDDFGIDAAIGFFVCHFPAEERAPVERAFEASSAAISEELSS